MRKTILLAIALVLGVSIGTAQNQVTNSVKFTDPSNGQSFILQPATGTANQVIIMPPDPPFANGFGLVVREVNGNTITTAWAPPWDPGAASRWVRKTADEANASAVNFVDATDMVFYVSPNKSYYIEGFLRVSNTGDANANVEINFTIPTGAVLNYYYVSSTQIGGTFQTTDADVSAGYTQTTNAVLPVNSTAVRYYNIQGLLVTGSTPGNVQLRFRRNGGAGSVNMLQNSILKIFTD